MIDAVILSLLRYAAVCYNISFDVSLPFLVLYLFFSFVGGWKISSSYR
jgi:hypothetical protein